MVGWALDVGGFLYDDLYMINAGFMWVPTIGLGEGGERA